MSVLVPSCCYYWEDIPTLPLSFTVCILYEQINTLKIIIPITQIRDQPVVGQLIPDSYLELEKRILLERKNVPIEFPVIDQKRLLELVRENQLQLDENELPHAIHFLNESGKIISLGYVC